MRGLASEDAISRAWGHDKVSPVRKQFCTTKMNISLGSIQQCRLYRARLSTHKSSLEKQDHEWYFQTLNTLKIEAWSICWFWYTRGTILLELQWNHLRTYTRFMSESYFASSVTSMMSQWLSLCGSLMSLLLRVWVSCWTSYTTTHTIASTAMTACTYLSPGTNIR